MSRQVLIKSQTHPYHVTARCLHKDFFPIPLLQVWFIMMRQLKRCQLEHNLAIHAFVLMGNHFHLLCHTPDENLDTCMHLFMRNVAVEVNRKANLKQPLWENRYRWSLIDSQRHYYQVYRYIYQNPLRAKLVSKVEDYDFSTLRQDIPFAIHSSVTMSFAGEEGELIWLNEMYEEEDLKLIKSGLRKYQFDLDKRKLKAFNKLSVPG